MLYIKDVLDLKHSGWLYAMTLNEIKIPLCFGTKVTLISNEKDYQLIKILEGPYINQQAKIRYQYKDANNGFSYLSEDLSFSKLKMRLNKTQKTLILNKKVQLQIQIQNNLLSGIYEILIPIRPISKAFFFHYYDEKEGGSRFINTWFKLCSKSIDTRDVYLHYGSYSKGCITVVKKDNFSAWNEVYRTLMRSRISSVALAELKVF